MDGGADVGSPGDRVRAALVRRAASGDPAAFAAIVDEFTPTVLAAAYGCCGDRDRAADIAQEVFITAFLKLHTLRQPAALPGWLMTVTRHLAARAATPPTLSVGLTADPDADVEASVLATDDASRVRRAVEALPAAQRLPVVLHYFAGRPLADVAGLLGVPLSTVKKRMRDARARLRTGGILMTDPSTTADRPPLSRPLADESDAVRVFSALRTGSPALLAALLDVRPDLVDVRERWTRAEGTRHRLPWTNGAGTPLLRAVERGDVAMVELLLDRGADVNAACACDGAETPLWVAAVQRDLPILDLLLAHGADVDSRAFAGLTALDVAVARGYVDVAARLRQAGATAETTHPFPQPPALVATATGIRAIDLWCPLPERGLIHMEFGPGLGAMVLLGELSRRTAARGVPVVWTGFVPRPLDLGDFRHVLAEADLACSTTLAGEPDRRARPVPVPAVPRRRTRRRHARGDHPGRSLDRRRDPDHRREGACRGGVRSLT